MMVCFVVLRVLGRGGFGCRSDLGPGFSPVVGFVSGF